MGDLQQKLDSILVKFDYRKETEFQGIRFEMTLLNIVEEQKMNSLPTAEEEDTLAFIDEMRRSIVSHAIRKIDDEEIPAIVACTDGDKEVTKERAIYLKSFLQKLPSAVTDHLFSVYVDLKEEAEQKFSDSVKYNWFKTPEERDVENDERLAKLGADAEAVTAAAAKAQAESEEKQEEAPVPDVEGVDLKPVKDDRDEEKTETA